MYGITGMHMSGICGKNVEILENKICLEFVAKTFSFGTQNMSGICGKNVEVLEHKICLEFWNAKYVQNFWNVKNVWTFWNAKNVWKARNVWNLRNANIPDFFPCQECQQN